LQHFAITFDGKKQCKILIFRSFETFPRCHGNKKFTIEHAITEAMVQSTFVPTVLIVLKHFYSRKATKAKHYSGIW
jgi:hypothetical protein